uniref:Polyadenylate-binding protein-interacting protein 2 n=1 Tax=Phallusia mammillata TaxID=59560 RepID=A0A6F9DP08_9ASCI|nr:polyadenylate-binding protein-interacting protein 2 [Phallusia mammillata]
MKGPPETLEKDRRPEINAVECIFEPQFDDAVNSAVVMVEPCIVFENQEEIANVGESEVNPPDVVDANDLLQEYGWMANSDEFDEEALEEIQQEDYIERCFEDMWQEEARIMHLVGAPDGPAQELQVENNLEKLSVNQSATFVPQAHLNPNADDFIPRSSSDS